MRHASAISTAAICLLVLIGGAAVGETHSTISIVDFGRDTSVWRSVDDVVMGGVSSSRMRTVGDAAVFEGTLSLENNGGFASVRSERLQADLTGCEGVRIRVRGDGNRYQFRIRSNAALDGPSHQLTFETRADEWFEVELPFSMFTAAYRGRPLPDYPPIDAGEIATVGFLIADKQEGEFRLEIDWVKAYRHEDGE